MILKNGPLLIIGGAEEKYHGVTILSKFVELSSKRIGKVGILTTATQIPEQVGNEYREVFEKHGVKDSVIIDVNSREMSEDPRIIETVDGLSALFITGGDQSRLTQMITGTKLHSLIYKQWQNGLVLGGTSAGASIMGKHMIVNALTKDSDDILQVEMDNGFGFMEDLLIDQHFSQRSRFDRLLGAIAGNPNLMGIGIDENTAILVEGDQFEVIGEHQVLILDGKDSAYVEVKKSDNGSEELTLSNFKLHTLTHGYKFDLKNRKLIVKGE
ncbi:cyanophycinase [Neobacillus notoginsengisoli]|uniref:Cyanophycinase n=1 Tax=Neobacillus notoginsengisoli TaxID=1578198 RepID=A0A417YQ02_9BACI|nr:cyanophycinase [Neobacillus notoginsengisoli]RHW35668.1 cyanophycinase [Neobacillus notoginsengisoli]